MRVKKIRKHYRRWQIGKDIAKILPTTLRSVGGGGNGTHATTEDMVDTAWDVSRQIVTALGSYVKKKECMFSRRDYYGTREHNGDRQRFPWQPCTSVVWRARSNKRSPMRGASRRSRNTTLYPTRRYVGPSAHTVVTSSDGRYRVIIIIDYVIE